MHVLFAHQNFPAQFGPVGGRMAAAGHRVTFASRTGDGRIPGVERLKFDTAGGATAQTNFFSRTFENMAWHSQGLYAALKARPDIRPDLVVAHSGFLSPLPLRDLYPGVPVVSYFEYFYHAANSDMDFRPDDKPADEVKTRARFRNAGLLLDLLNCDAGYSPTGWQRDRLPAEFRPKVRVIFDGVDTAVWKPVPQATPRRAGSFAAPEGKKVVTYAARGLEAMRGFDIFMRFAKLLYTRRDDVHFVVIGQDKVFYGGDEGKTGGKTFKEWVLAQDSYDLSRFTFLPPVKPEVLAEFFSLSDLHVYLTVPFVLSWSLLDALACGATVLASDTPPVREVVDHGRNGLLAPFFEPEAMAGLADRALSDPAGHRHLREGGMETVRSAYSLDVCLPQLVGFYEEVAGRVRV
ncbi:MAG: glycosyltransferase [Gemmataceae bacterium]|nr:glycosyltransferase [Gemmataceae bacterium]